MGPEISRYLWDAQEAAERIQRFVAGRGFEDYLGDELLRSAVERQLSIIGEALAQLRRMDQEAAERIPDLPRIVALRNILVHAYALIDDRLVWGIVEAKLSPLLTVLGSLLEEE